MGLFVCDKCGCVDNTATGWYWPAFDNETFFGPDYPNHQVMCSECTPDTFASGKPNEGYGVWHNKFPKKPWDGKRKVMNR